MADLRIGVVGAGVIAQLAELPILASTDGVTLGGLVTDNPKDTAVQCARWPIERGYETVEQMIGGANLDALVVLTPKQHHSDFVRIGLESDLDVFCEKPLTSSLAEAESLVELSAKSKALLMVGFNRRYAEVYRVAHEEFQDRQLQFVVAQKNRVGTEYRATLENGIHLLDLLRWFCGEAVSVTARSQAEDPYREDGVTALITFDSGISAAVAVVRCAGEWDERFELYGSDTTVRVVAPDTVTVIRDGVASSRDLRARANGWNDVKTSAGFAPAMDHFLHCVRTREKPLTDGREALESQRLMHRVLVASGLPTEDAPLTS